jgi:hypothetical protein
VITRDRLIIDGYARLELARQFGRATVLCIEYDISEEQSLRWLIQSHCPSRGLNAYCRILLALDLEPFFRERSRANQHTGGRNRGSSNLTEAETFEVRTEIARMAGVSCGNVTKARQLRNAVHTEIEQAVRTGEISIHRGWKWIRDSHMKQLSNLRLRRIERGIKKKARELVAAHQAKLLASTPEPPSFTLLELVQLASRLSNMTADESSIIGPVVITTLDVPGMAIYISQELAQAFKPQEETTR